MVVPLSPITKWVINRYKVVNHKSAIFRDPSAEGTGRKGTPYLDFVS